MLFGPFLMNILMYSLDGSSIIPINGKYTTGYKIELNEPRRMKWLTILSAVNALCGIYINFVSIRKSRDKKSPHNTSSLYSEAGCCIKFNRVLFVAGIIYCNIINPLSALTVYLYFSFEKGVWIKNEYCVWFVL